jgi:hypothetical protein
VGSRLGVGAVGSAGLRGRRRPAGRRRVGLVPAGDRGHCGGVSSGCWRSGISGTSRQALPSNHWCGRHRSAVVVGAGRGRVHAGEPPAGRRDRLRAAGETEPHLHRAAAPGRATGPKPAWLPDRSQVPVRPVTLQRLGATIEAFNTVAAPQRESAVQHPAQGGRGGGVAALGVDHRVPDRLVRTSASVLGGVRNGMCLASCAGPAHTSVTGCGVSAPSPGPLWAAQRPGGLCGRS